MNNSDMEKCFSEEDSTLTQQNNIIEDVIKLEQQLKDPNIKSFKKTIYWNQPNTMESTNIQDKFLKDIVDCLTRIEFKLEDIKNFLSTPKFK
ncbi:MAG: hypothetical protein PHT02_13765 [Tissierellia bacterium]|nr:hypothetical protein [Tissierellia bacterium]